MCQIRGGGGGVAGSQPMSTAVHRSPNKLRRSNSILTYVYKHLQRLRYTLLTYVITQIINNEPGYYSSVPLPSLWSYQ
jgi:hypothetical protein